MQSDNKYVTNRKKDMLNQLGLKLKDVHVKSHKKMLKYNNNGMFTKYVRIMQKYSSGTQQKYCYLTHMKQSMKLNHIW
jgi:hypothetical protein